MPEEIVHIDLEREVTIGVVGDTHIPDRVNGLHPDLLPGLAARKVDLILHTGDICTMQVLEELGKLAPVRAVRGNRDFLLPASIRMVGKLLINSVRILLVHGHVNSWHYWMDKLEYMVVGYKPERYVQRLQGIDPSAQVVIFGHSHRAENNVFDDVLYFNPGSSSSGDMTSSVLSYGIVKISATGIVASEVISLEGYRIKAGRWVKTGKQ